MRAVRVVEHSRHFFTHSSSFFNFTSHRHSFSLQCALWPAWPSIPLVPLSPKRQILGERGGRADEGLVIGSPSQNPLRVGVSSLFNYHSSCCLPREADASPFDIHYSAVDQFCGSREKMNFEYRITSACGGSNHRGLLLSPGERGRGLFLLQSSFFFLSGRWKMGLLPFSLFNHPSSFFFL